VLGPLLARHGVASIALPGGDDFGQRPINFHLRAHDESWQCRGSMRSARWDARRLGVPESHDDRQCAHGCGACKRFNGHRERRARTRSE
jgi:hypothetical protein